MYPRHRHVRPRLEVLEGREIPAGNVTAALVGGQLRITGDDQGNGVTLLVTGTSVTVKPTDASTSVNGQVAVVVLSGAATSLSANLGGGNDFLSIDGSSDFVLTGAAAISLGGGTNTLNLTTNGRITLGSLAVTSGPGSNFVTVSPGAGLGTVNGQASFSFGGGGTNVVTLGNTNFPGPTGVRVATGSGGSNIFRADSLTVSGTLSVGTGGQLGSQIFTNDTLGGLTLTGAAPNINLSSTTIRGNLSEIGDFTTGGGANNVTVTGNVTVRSGVSDARLAPSGTFVAGNVTLTAGGSSTLDPFLITTFTAGNVALTSGGSSLLEAPGAPFTVGNVTLTSGGSSTLNPSSGTFAAGNVTLTSGGSASLSAPRTFTARNVSVSGPVSGTFSASGTSATINGNLSVTSRQTPSLRFSTSALSEVKGNVVVGGSTFNTFVNFNGNLKADRNVTVTASPNSVFAGVLIGDTAAAAAILGNLTVATGNGQLAMGLTNLTVGGDTRVTTGAAADTLGIDGTTFRGAFTANTGAGADTFDIARMTGMPAPVTFAGMTTINAGPENDTLLLGTAVVAGGDANSKAVFSVPTSRLNGGPGFNGYFKSFANVSGLTPANFLNWMNS